MEVAQVEPACTVDSQPVEDPPAMKFVWPIEHFTRLNTKKHYSDMFVVGGYKWRILIFPKRNNVDYLSMYLDVADSGTLPYGWSRYAHFRLAVVNQIHPKYSIRKDTQHQFNARESDWGFTSFMLLGDLYDQSRGYLVNNTVVVEAEISVSKVLDYGSYDSKKETGYVGLKNQGANGHMNSLLQTWYHIPYFRKCVHHVPTTEDGMPSGSIPLALQRLFYKLQYSESSVATKELTKSFGPTHDLFMKHDPPELNRVLIEKLEDKMKGTIVEGTIQQLFEGHYRNYIECFNVDYKSTWKESFYDLQLDVKGCRDVYASFSKFVEVKRLEGDNKYHSEELGLQDAKKGVLFIDFPPVLQLQLKRFEYDFMQDTTVKINDRYEFPLQLDLDRENGKYLSPESDKSVRNLYTLHSVLVHSGGVHGGHYHAFIRPTLSDQWYKFGDKCVTKEDAKRALEEQYGGEDETSPDFNNTPFKLTRYSDAYMLVYVRESDKDKVICNVDEKDIAEHLKIRLKKEQEIEKKERFKEQANHYTIIKVVRDEDLAEQIGRDIYFDLVDHDKVRKFRIHEQMPFNLFKEEVAKEFGIPVRFQRFWIWAKRQNHTCRPHRPLTPGEESQSVGQLIEVSNKTHNAELRLFLEVEFGPDLRPIPPPVKTKEDILLFFKLYEPEKQELRFVGRFFVKSSSKPAEILGKLNQLAGFTPDEEIELYEEIKFEPCIMCEHLDKKTSFRLSQIKDGDIICFQKSTPLESEEECKYTDVPSFLEYVHNRQQQQEDEEMLVPHSDLVEGPQPMEAQVEPASTVDSQPVEDPPTMKFTWTIENFTRLNIKKHYSDMFVVGGYKWRILIFPKGNNVDYLSMYLDVADSGTLPYGWSRYAHFSLAVVNQMHTKYSIRKDTQHQFNARESDWGFTSFMPLGDLYDPSRGYLVNDTVVVEAEVAVRKVLDYWSYDSKKETGYVGLKNQGATCYMNSLLQTLYHIPYFRKAVYHMPTTENDMPSGSIPLALQSLFYKLQYNDSSVATKELTKSFGWDTYDSFMQHDVQELNRVLCEKLEDKMKGTVVEGTIQQLFEGHHMNYIECINVDYKSTRKESFYDLQLDVKGCRDVYASFDKYVEVERLEGDNKYHAEEHGLQDAKKGVLFIDFPPVLQLQLKRFEYDFMRDTMVKINDHYEFPLQLDLDRENGKYLSPESDKSVRNLYTLHSVLVHSGGLHVGHYYAFIRPTLSDQWYKFDDERVTKEDVKRALEEQYGGEEELPQTNPGFNHTPFKFTKYSNAYMLVYIRDSDKDKIICNVDEKDIAEHLRIRLKKEQEETEDKRRYKAQAHLYRIIKVARDEDLTEQIGRDIYFDLVDHDKVRSFRIQNQTPFNLFKEELAKEFGIPVQFQRFWIWAKRQNHTYRPNRPLTPQEETQSVGQLIEVSNKTHNAELRLFLELEFGPDLRPIPPPDKTKEDILLFFKLYEPEKRELRFVGRFFVKSSSKPEEILGKLNQLAGFTPDEEIELYEELKFEPCIMCEHLDKRFSFRTSQIEDGDIICFQKSTPLETEEECKYPDAPSFLEYVHNRQVVHFRSLEKPKEEDFSLELSKLHTYDDVVENLAPQIGLEDPTKIRLTAHNCYSQQPNPQPIKFRGVEHLTDMLVHYNQSSDILYYEVLDIPLPELQGLKNLKVAFHHATKDEVVIHNIRLPKQSTVGDVINVLKTKVELSHPNAELRLLEVFYHKIYKIFPHSEKIENVNDQYWTLRAEEIPEEEKNLGPHDRLIHVYHFTKDTAQNQMQVQNFGEPFFLVIHEGETLAEVKERIQNKLRVPDEEFAKWKFAFLSLGRPEYLQDSDVVSSHFQRRDVYGAWEQYLGLEHSDETPKRAHAANQSRDKYAAWEQYLGLQHSDKAPKRARAANQASAVAANQASAVVNISFPTTMGHAEPTPQEDAALVTLESIASNVGHETASREIEMQNDDLDGPASPAVDRTLRRLSAAEDLLKSTSAREPSVEALAALDTVSRYARSSLDTLSTNGAYEEFKAALKLLTEQGMIHSTITSMLKDLLSSLEGEMPKYMAAVKELAEAENFPIEHEEIKVKMGLAMQICQERKDIVANYDAKVTELEAELARVKAQLAQVKADQAEAMANLETGVDEMEPFKQRYADSSLKSEYLIVRQATLTLQNCGSVGTWAVLQDVLKKYFKF